MNKYLKILALSGGLVGAILPTAIDTDKDTNNDLGAIYEQVEKMQQVIPKLSRIEYKFNIDLDTTNTENHNDVLTDDLQQNNSNNDVTFTTTDDNGNETSLTNQETINYLDETLKQTNIEYEQLKQTLTSAIKDTMDYLDAYKNGEYDLSNEQKISMKQQYNSIKFMAETLEDLSEDVICQIDGCENCDEDFEQTANNYLRTINNLESRIDALNNALSSLRFINNIGNPFFFSATRYNNYNNDENDNSNTVLEVEKDQNENNEQSGDSVDSSDNTQDSVRVENNETDSNSDASVSSNKKDDNDDKPTTFGLKSNIDTYAPTKRNIDTFFNTALYNNDYLGNGNAYGYGYMPYGYGGNYGYGMPYGGGFGNPYGGLNSNIINRETV